MLNSCLSLVFCGCRLVLMTAEALWVDLQHCYKLGLAVKVAKGIIALAVCPGLNVWIAAHQGKSILFNMPSYTKRLVFFPGGGIHPPLCISLCLGRASFHAELDAVPLDCLLKH